MGDLRVLVAEDHQAVREVVVSLLRSAFHVVGAVADGDQLVEAASLLRPDVIVSDIGMPGTDGLTARKKLLSRGIAIPFVFVTMLDIASLPTKAVGLGYVHKADLGTELIDAVHEISKGGWYVSRTFSEDRGSAK